MLYSQMKNRHEVTASSFYRRTLRLPWTENAKKRERYVENRNKNHTCISNKKQLNLLDTMRKERLTS